MCPYVSLFGLTLSTYGLCMAMAMMVSFGVIFYRVRQERLDVNNLLIIFAFAFGFGLIGAKILYLFSSCDIRVVFQEMLLGDFSALIGGGLVFYGGLIAGAFGAVLGFRVAGATKQMPRYVNAIVPCIPLGHAIGRLGCFFAGCCYGAPYEGPFAVTFPAIGLTHSVFPVQALEALLNVLLFVVLLIISIKKNKPFFTLSLYLVSYALLRFALEFLRGDEIRGFASGLSTSQWISLALFLVGLALLRWTSNNKSALSK